MINRKGELSFPNKPPSIVDHRWHRAIHLVSNRRKPSKVRDDLATTEAWKYLESRHRLAVTDCRGRWPIAFLWVVPEASVAAADEHSPRWWELQARLLAGEPHDRIASRSGLSANAVSAFADLFFDVGPHLHDQDFVATVALTHCRLMWPEDTGPLLGLFGYSLGAQAVDALIDYFANPPIKPKRRETPCPTNEKRLRWGRRVDLSMDILHSPSDGKPDAVVSRLIDLLRELGRGLVAEVPIHQPPPLGQPRADPVWAVCPAGQEPQSTPGPEEDEEDDERRHPLVNGEEEGEEFFLT